jgi:hypothetical protein
MINDSEKKFIATQIKNISINHVDSEINKLIQIGTTAYNLSPRSRIGNNVVDYFTFVQRLETRGKYDINFFEFIENIEEFKKKKFIQTMFKYYKEVKNKSDNVIVFFICVNSFAKLYERTT